MKVTIKDIAKKANVSIATVSRVVNQNPFVKEETKEKVLKVIKELDYHPDLIARSMVKQRTFSIGLIVGGLGNPFFAETAEVIIKTAEKFNCHVNVYVSEEKSEKMEQYIDLLITKRVDGVIIGSVFQNTSLEKFEKVGIPYVLYNRKNNRENADFIVQDNSKGAYEVVSHLIKLGHKRIGLIHGPLIFDTVEGRIEGYYEALKAFNLKAYDHLSQAVDFMKAEEQVPIVMEKMFAGNIKPTAIFTTADYLALDAMDYLINNGYQVPKDVAVAGFDNIRLSRHSLIGLTTVGVRAEEMARLAVEKLMQKIESKEHPQDEEPWKIKLQPELVIRKTCGYDLATKLV